MTARLYKKSVNIIFLLSMSIQTPVWPSDQDTADKTPDSTAVQIIQLIHQSRNLSETYPIRAIEYAKIALQIAKNLKLDMQLAESYLAIAEGYEGSHNYAKAFEYYLEALKIYESEDDPEMIALTLDNLGFIYWYLGDWESAIIHYEKSLSYAAITQNPDLLINYHNHMGLVLWRKDELNAALAHYAMALKIAEEEKKEKRVSAILNNIGIAYIHQADYEKAILHFHKALRINQDINRARGITENLNNIGHVYLKQARYDLADKTLKTARQYAEEHPFIDLLNDNNRYYSVLYTKLKDYRKAFYYLSRYFTVRDSLSSSTTKSKVEELQITHLLEKKENEIHLINAEKKLKEIKLKAIKTRYSFTLLISGIILLSSIIIIIQQRHKLKAYQILARKNKAIVEFEKKLSEYEMNSKKITIKTSQPVQNEPIESEKYASSNLTEVQKNDIIKKVQQLLEYDKFYLHHDMTLNKLSENVNISRTYLSQVINEKYHMSFTNLLNNYRIKEARRLLSEGDSRIYTIESIAKSVGFNSINAFNRSFKKFTGITPSFYINSLKSEWV